MKTGSKNAVYKGRFPLQPYRSETYRISLFCDPSGKTNDMDTIEYATFRYDTVEVENGLKSFIIIFSVVIGRKKL